MSFEFDTINPIYCAIRSYLISGIVRTDDRTQAEALAKANTLLKLLQDDVSKRVSRQTQEEEEEVPRAIANPTYVWEDQPVFAVYPGCKPQFSYRTWTEMGEGGWEGGRHNMLRWLARRGRTSFDRDIARDKKGSPLVSLTAMSYAKLILQRDYDEDILT